MGFHLWVDDELAWAQGTYEYRPMGTAVISVSDPFRRRDFNPRRPVGAPHAARYAGQFASLGHVNAELLKRRPVGLLGALLQRFSCPAQPRREYGAGPDVPHLGEDGF